MKRLPHLFFFLLLSGCAHPPPPTPDDIVQGIPSVEYAMISYGNEVERDDQLFLLDSRACFTVDGIARIVMHFRTQRLVDLCEGRDLIVKLVEGFLKRMNSDSNVAGSLHPYPLTADRLKINIEFESFYGRFIDPLYMGRINLEKGIVFYYTHDSLDPDTVHWKQRVEPYDKALRFSRFRNEDRMQFPVEPANSCLGGKAGPKNRAHSKNADDHYDHVVSRTTFESSAVSEDYIEAMNGECGCVGVEYNLHCESNTPDQCVPNHPNHADTHPPASESAQAPKQPPPETPLSPLP